jgi:hypothetical protein
LSVQDDLLASYHTYALEHFIDTDAPFPALVVGNIANPTLEQ